MSVKSVDSAEHKPSVVVSSILFIVAVALMAYLRLYLFDNEAVALTYGLPLLICLWYQDRRLLWSLVGAFTVMATIKSFFVLPGSHPNDWPALVQWSMQIMNIVVIGAAVHAIITLTRQLRGKNAAVEAANEELAARQEEISRQNDELQSQSEELAQQNEELQQQAEELNQQNEEMQQQSEELEQQSEELQTQAEELRATNDELNQREAMLAAVLDSLHGAHDEQQAMAGICHSLVPLLAGQATAAAVVEQVGQEFVVRMHTNLGELAHERWPAGNSFAQLVMERGQTGYIDDLAARPDLTIPHSKRQRFRSILATPLRVHGQYIGAVEAYSAEPRHWTTEHFRIIEWVAAQCSILLELLRAQESVRLSEQRYSSFVKASAQVIWSTDSHGQVNMDIPAWQALTGQSAEQAQGFGWMDAIHVDDRPRVAEAWRKACETRGIYEVEYRLRIHDGTWRNIQARGVPVLTADGHVREYIGTCIDVTERKQAEEALQESEHRFQAMADAIPQLAWMAKGDGYIFWYNRRWYEYTGTTPQQMEGWGWQRVHDPDMLPQVLERWQASIATGDPFDMEFPLRGADGQFRWFLTRVMPLKDAEGRVVRWFGTNTDISERRQTAQALRQSLGRFEVLAATAEALLQTREPQNLIESLCRRVMEQLDCHAFFNFLVDEKAGKLRLNACAGIPDEEARRIEWLDYGTAVCGCAARDGCRIVAEHIPTTPDPRTKLVKGYGIKAYACHPLLGPEGKVLGTLSFGSRSRETFSEDDLSLMRAVADQVATAMVRMRGEQQLKEWNETLERRVQERTAEAEHRARQLQQLAGELTQAEHQERRRLAQVLHDGLQQLLVGAKFNLGILRSQMNDSQLHQGIQHVDNLIDESLATSRSLTAELSPPILHEGSFVQVLHWLSRWARDKHALTVEVQADEQAAPKAESIRLLLFQAVRELLLNIRKHAGVDHACIHLRPLENNQAEITVADRGAGFDPDRQPEQGSNDGKSGSGFGLFSIRERLELLGGRMQVHSSPGQGTNVRLIVPCEPAAGIADDGAKDEHPDVVRHPDGPVGEPEADGQKVRVLLADDHAVVRDGLARLLQIQPDITVIGQAEDGRQAVEMALQLRPEVILMDVSMPELTGVEAARRIMQDLPSTKIIGLSMHTQEDIAAEMLAAGAARYLTKTSPPAKLMTAIRECAGRG